MLRNWLAAAFRSLGRNRLHAGISLFGLAFGIAAALIAALVVRAEMTYDAYVPARERTYTAAMLQTVPDLAPRLLTDSHHDLAALLEANLPQVEAISRLSSDFAEMQKDNVRARERINWSDANIFDLLPLSAIAGDLHTALSRPDGLVLTPEISRKYFGKERAIGATLLIDNVPMRVTAIIEPPPAHRTVLQTGIFASAQAEVSPIAKAERDPNNKLGEPGARAVVKTLLRASPGVAPEQLEKVFDGLLSKIYPGEESAKFFRPVLLRLDRTHLDPLANPGARDRLAMIAATGALILLVACINFVNLATARAATRAMEVGVRKSLGASRGALIVQFLGEALLYVLSATVIGAMATELLLPHVNAFLETGASFDLYRDPAMLGWTVAGILATAIVAGLYPAFVLSSFKPAVVLKGVAAQSRAANVARQALVIVQFAVLIGFIIAAVIIYQQRAFASSGGVRAPTDQHYIMQNVPCESSFAKELPRLAGVQGVSCTGWAFLGNFGFMATKKKDGSYLTIGVSAVDERGLPLYGIRPLAGRLYRNGVEGRTHVVINEAAVRMLGYGTPEQALGKVLPVPIGGQDVEVLGVVKDFGILMVYDTMVIKPTVFLYKPDEFALFDVKMSGQSIPETLAAIDKLWRRTTGAPWPGGQFVDQMIEENYRAMLRQARLFGILSVVAVVLSCLGLIGLSAAATARRTREIGVRKAMGADRGQIVRLLLWKFSQPVLLAAILACPIAALLLGRWLSHFAYHIDLAAWPFLASTALTLSVALLTVSAHCYSVASEKPVSALRYQ